MLASIILSKSKPGEEDTLPQAGSAGGVTLGLMGLAVLALVVCCFSPHLWIVLQHDMVGSFEWDRARTYLAQCSSPFVDPAEPAMRWRLLPQVLIYLTGSSRTLALAFPWIGAWVLCTYLYVLCRRRLRSRWEAFLVAAGLAATSPVLISTGWMGFNDAWVGAALLYVAFGRSVPGAFVVTLLGAFVDERLVAGLPGAALLRFWPSLSNNPARGLWQAVIFVLLLVGPYFLVRATAAHYRPPGKAYHVEITAMLRAVPYFPLGIWVAMRFALLAVADRMTAEWERIPAAYGLLLAGSLIPAVAGCLLASDYERTAGILLPLCTWAGIASAERYGARWAMLFAGAMLLLPSLHVTDSKIEWVGSLPTELVRLLH